MAATEWVPVLMTTAEKKRIVARAKKAGLTTAEFMRRAAKGYSPAKDEAALVAMIEEMNRVTANTEKTIDAVLKFVADSNKRIARLEAKAKCKAA
jgi:hypothetical protein